MSSTSRRTTTERYGQAAVALGGVGLLALLAAADFVPPGAEWFAGHPMTSAALSTVVGFVAVTLFVEKWLKDREAAQLGRISTVAYRSLAQYANDAGRSLLAPLVGADLARLGVPSSWPEGLDAITTRLTAAGFARDFHPDTGSWKSISRTSHGHVLEAFLDDPAFLEGLFLCAAAERRRLHQATAVWAPVMLISATHAEELGDLRTLTDAMELLQERVRASGITAWSGGPWVPRPGWSADAVCDAYWTAVTAYEPLRNHLGDQADLPSDDLLVRRHE
jgi:hypothetical protein